MKFDNKKQNSADFPDQKPSSSDKVDNAKFGSIDTSEIV